MKFLIAPLADLFYFTIEGIKATNSIFTSGYQLSYFIGQNIVLLLFHVVEKVWLTLQLLYHAAYILYEDYCFFIADLICKLKCFLDGIQYSIKYAFACYQQVTTGVRSIYDSVVYYLGSNLEFVGTIFGKGVSYIFSALQILKQSLIFMGNGIWFLISFVPLSIVYVITLFLCFISQSAVELYMVLCNIFVTILSITENIVIFFSDVPAEAAFGLLLGCICVYFFVKNYILLARYILYISSSLLRSGRIINRVWNLLIYLIRRIFCFRSTPIIRTSHVEMRQAYNVNRYENSEYSDNASARTRSSDHSGKLCIVCQDLEKSVIILPCRHVCLCTVCCDIIEEQYGRCPICRRRVERTMTVYI